MHCYQVNFQMPLASTWPCYMTFGPRLRTNGLSVLRGRRLPAQETGVDPIH